ncbi:uncharacterized protein LOC124373221, partial [Homalodisca vitripennis]|uniref:uncharacterized protein LOC124373221 n=1 Tax=Homalodisca vitripennis TaxID=197043 RepID=UPI001EEA4CC4
MLPATGSPAAGENRVGNTKHLISVVRAHTVPAAGSRFQSSLCRLWDKSGAEYSDKNIRDRAWIEIGIAMYEDWNCATLNERDDRVKEMKNKWRHIRDHFFRVVNKGKSGDAAPKKKKKYIYADSLSFLMSYETKRPTSGNIAATEDENVDEPQESEASEEADETRPVEERPATEKNTATDKNIREPAVKKKKLSAFQSELLKKLDTSSATEEDVD